MNKLVPVIAVSALLLLTACPYDTLYMSDIRQVAAALVDTNTGNQPPNDGTCVTAKPSRSYDFVCGGITTTVCKDSADIKTNSGRMDWTVPMGSKYSRGVDCTQDANGHWCCPADGCDWRGLDKNTGTGKGGAADCVVKWRHETCSSPGSREGKHGHVVACDPNNVDTYIPADAAYDICDDVG